MGAFWGSSLLWPRSTDQRIISRDLVINVMTGGSIFVLAKPLTDWLSTQLQWSFWAPPIESSVLQFLLAFVLLDFTRYWLHYAHHRVPLLWRFTYCAPQLGDPDVTSGLRMHGSDFCSLHWCQCCFLVSAWMFELGRLGASSGVECGCVL